LDKKENKILRDKIKEKNKKIIKEITIKRISTILDTKVK